MGMSLEDCFIHHDQDTVYAGYRWLQAVLIRERVGISFSENGAKGNTYKESFNGHFKGESECLFFDAKNMWELGRKVHHFPSLHDLTIMQPARLNKKRRLCHSWR